MRRDQASAAHRAPMLRERPADAAICCNLPIAAAWLPAARTV